MANKFYEIGRAGGEKVTDYSKAIAPALQSMYKQMLDSKEKLDAFMLKSPQGVAMDKVPEQARAYVTTFLADGKQRYTQAAKVLSSGVNSSSQQYMDAVEIMNQVQNSFENLNTQLTTYNSNAVEQRLRVDDIQVGTTSPEMTNFNNYITGDIFTNGSVDKDGNILYNSADTTISEQQKIGEAKFPGQSTDRAGETFRAINTGVMTSKKSGDSWELSSIQLQKDYDRVMNNLNNTGRRELVFSDEDYMQTIITVNKADDEEGYEKELMEIKMDSEKSKNAIGGYKEHNMKGWKSIYDLSQGPQINNGESRYFDGFVYHTDDIGGYSAELKSSDRKKIDQRTTYGDYVGRRGGTYVYDSKTDTYNMTIPAIMSEDGSAILKPEIKDNYTPWEVLKEEGLLRDGETDPNKYKTATQQKNQQNTPTPPTPLFNVDEIISGINENIFNQDAKKASDELGALFVNIPGFKVESTERGGVIIKYKGKQVEVPARAATSYMSEKDKEALTRSKSTLEKWLRTVAVKPTI
tara:strand:- start:481 stop:2046 length:1566 start_codon:yes stop_codon:yes gene_type:complete